jgi:multidrug efflux pump subunit AcrA (membrane-fusion protein)
MGGLTRVSIIFGLAALLLSGCSALSPAAATPTPQASDAYKPLVSVTGIVVPAQWATLSASISGSVAEMLVKEGEQVKAGQTLIRLDGSDQLQAAVTAANLELVTAQQALDELNKTAAVQRADAELALAQANKALEDAKKERDRKNYQRAGQNLLDTARADYNLSLDAVKKAEDAYTSVENLAEDDPNRAAALSALGNARIARDRALWNLNYLLGRPNANEVAEAEGRLTVAKANVDDAKRKLDELNAGGPDPKALELARARLQNAQSQLAAANDSLAHTQIKAPFAGTISKLHVHQGEWVDPGLPVLILADLTSLRVETTDLNEIDMAQISAGKPARVTFDALPEVIVQGKVSSIAPKSSEGSGVNFTAVVELSQVPPQLRWGMTAFVDVQKND